MASSALATLLILLAGSIAIFFAILRFKDGVLGKITTVILTANVLFLLYLLTYPLDFGLESADIFTDAGLAEVFAVTPALASYGAALLVLGRLRGFAPVVVPLIIVNILLSVAVLATIGACF